MVNFEIRKKEVYCIYDEDNECFLPDKYTFFETSEEAQEVIKRLSYIRETFHYADHLYQVGDSFSIPKLDEKLERKK